jgi:hypothetical protein
MSKLGNIGDVNPIEYGGGYILSAPKQGQWLEWFDGLDCEERAWEIELDNPEHLKRTVTLYRPDIERDGKAFLSSYNWVDWSAVAETCGQSADVYSAGNLKTAAQRARALQDAAGYYGWHEFDHYPLTLTLGELIERWKGY